MGALTSLWDKEKILNVFRNPKQYRDIMFAIGILGIIGLLLFPISTLLLDFLLSVSVAFSVLILMTVLFIDTSLDFSSFPTVLLIVTMMRLALNISTTRLILANGHLGANAAGHVVEAFGYFVSQGSVVIGAIIFAILTIINFIVITKGSGRVAEVAARFNLDAMPGKQMSIDADLSSGLIKETEAKARRKTLEHENTFYGAMDGASKFVRGDAIAGLLITFINFVAGILIGTIQRGMYWKDALKAYTILTIGDGLVTQIPALLVSTSAGLLVTKAGVQGSVDKAIFEQLGKYPHALTVSAGLLFFMALLMPGIPFGPFAITAAVCALIAFFLYKGKVNAAVQMDGDSSAQELANNKEMSEQAILQSLRIDSIKIELGYELLPLIGGMYEYKITDQVKKLRQQIAKELGFILPSVRIQDNMQIDSKKYVLKIKEIECGSGMLMPNKILVMGQKGKLPDIEGEETLDPIFNIPAKWADKSMKEEAILEGLTVVEPTSVIITHLTEIIKSNIIELLTYEEVQNLTQNLSQTHKKLIEEIIPSQLTMVVLQRVLQKLLSEGVSIRDLSLIIESISEVSASIKSAVNLTEHVRMRLAKNICQMNMNDKGYMPIVVLSPKWEQIFSESIVGEGDNKQHVMQPTQLHDFVLAVNSTLKAQVEQYGEMPVILTSPSIRPFVRSVIERFKPETVVMSQNEIHIQAKIKTLGQI